jgi:serine/threonine protein kinase
VAADLQDGLRRAAQARIALEHPNLLPARAERDGNGHIALRLRPYSAPTLTQVISSGPSSPRDALRILRGVALAVEALGRAGLVARDLNPDHILVCPRRGGILADLAISPELLPRAPGGDDRNYAYRSRSAPYCRSTFEATCTPWARSSSPHRRRATASGLLCLPRHMRS